MKRKTENEDSLDEILTCNICEKYFSNPITLPCGNSVCGEHIDETGSDYKCEICSKKHAVPEDGFCINKNIVKLSKLNNHLDDKTKSLHQIIDEFEKVLKELSLLCRDPASFIFDYVSEAKFKIDLEREKLIERIHKVSDGMLDKLVKFEDDAKANLKSIDDLLDRHQLEIDKLEQLSEKWKDELRTPKLEQKRVDEMINDAHKYLTENRQKSFEYKNKVLNGKGCFFVPKDFKLDNDNFGQLVLIKFEYTNKLEISESKVHLIESNIIKPSQALDLIKLCEFDSSKKYRLIYRASRDGFGAKSFHAKCDNIRRTLSIIKVKDKSNIFGGYTESGWDSTSSFKQDDNAFIFSLINKDNKRIKMKSTDEFSLYCRPDYHITFGDECLEIVPNSNANTSFSNLGGTYAHPTYQYDSNNAKRFLAGTEFFLTTEIEVFKVE